MYQSVSASARIKFEISLTTGPNWLCFSGKLPLQVVISWGFNTPEKIVIIFLFVHKIVENHFLHKNT